MPLPDPKPCPERVTSAEGPAAGVAGSNATSPENPVSTIATGTIRARTRRRRGDAMWIPPMVGTTTPSEADFPVLGFPHACRVGAGRLRWRDHGRRRLMDGIRSPRSAAKSVARRVQAKALGTDRGLAALPPELQLSVVYELLLGRRPDPSGSASYLPGLRDGSMSPSQLAEWIYASSEWATVAPFTQLAPSLHFSRSLFVRSLPRASRILDLGGTALGSDKGAMVVMGYPYAFDELVVVDLPSEDRNALYREDDARNVTHTELGPVRYRY